MKFLSLFTGVGGFDLGLERAGMTCIGQAERDPHCLKVLSYHYPNVPKFKDVRDVTRNTVPTVDLVCGGFPCQDVSVAGNRAGLAGERSGLWFEFLRILHELKPSWVVIENVPGLLSSNAGRDFATILHGLGECGYQSAWRVLDSQYWGVAQRRRRVFIVGCIGSGRAAEVLFEREGGYWNTPARREAGFWSINRNDTSIVENVSEYCSRSISGALTIGSQNVDENSALLNQLVIETQGIRRLTPLEWERLQGFPAGWTDVCGMSDAQRYKQMGNAVTVNVIEWLGRRIAEVKP